MTKHTAEKGNSMNTFFKILIFSVFQVGFVAAYGACEYETLEGNLYQGGAKFNNGAGECRCHIGDEIVTGGCTTERRRGDLGDDSINASFPIFQDHQWSWKCLSDYKFGAVGVRIVCRTK